MSFLECTLDNYDMLTNSNILEYIGTDIIFILMTFCGHVQGMTLRNLTWHGFLTKELFNEQFTSFLLILILSLYDKFNNRMKDTTRRKLLNDEDFMKKLKFNFPMCAFKKSTEELNSIIKLINRLRCLFVRFNSCENRVVCADNEELHTIFYEMLSPTMDEPQTPILQILKRQTDKISVCLRIRPSSDKNNTSTLTKLDSNTVLVEQKQDKYFFNNIYDRETSQEELYKNVGKPLLDSFFNGTSSLLFSYGVTNSGKSWTILGNDENKGIIPRTLQDCFGKLELINKFGSSQYFLKISFVQIYNEQIYDLINNNQKRNLKLDSTGGLCIENVKEARISSLEEAQYYLAMGIHSRKKCQTTLNVASSRSHSVFTLKLYEKNLETNDVYFLEKYSIVDLAGSERNKRTNTHSDDLKDASYINKSLCILGRCLNDIQWNQRHSEQNQKIVPFRESKLTRIFQDLMEKGNVVMIVHANPSINDLDETCAVLKYSAIASRIETGCRYNQATPRGKRQLFPSTPQSSHIKSQQIHENAKKQLLKNEQEIIELKDNFAKEIKEKDKYYLNLVLTLETQIEDLKVENNLLRKSQLNFDSTCDKMILSNQTKEAEIERLKNHLYKEQKRNQEDNEELERQFQIELFETNCAHRTNLAQKDEEIEYLKSLLEQQQQKTEIMSPRKKKILQNVPMNLLTPKKDDSESLYDKWTSNKKNQPTHKYKENNNSKKLLFK
eukprot:gene5627-9444_t